MTVQSYLAFDHPAAWKAADFPSTAYQRTLSAAERGALLQALEASGTLALEQLTPETFALDSIQGSIKEWAAQLKTGCGLVMLKHMPIEGMSSDEASRLFYGLGSHFGLAVSQSNDGELVGHVVNIGGQDARERAYRNARQLSLHTDRCDHIGMLCLRPALRGGVSGYASALAVHNQILGSRPELLDALYQGFYLHRFGEQIQGSTLTPEPVPVFSVTDGVPNIVYIRGYIDLAVNEGHYELTPLQQDALDYFDEVANQADTRLDMALETGDATFTNNCVLVHNRTSFEDAPDPAQRRHLLRLWLMDPDVPASEAVQRHKNMKGIEKIAGRGTYYGGPGRK
ncbi:MAG: hypothetical protein HOI95_13055 [Chromatiales bacterium]|jgi:hypothetical protein|nr:hypothetical protein [Chromatiales bacterium]